MKNTFEGIDQNVFENSHNFIKSKHLPFWKQVSVLELHHELPNIEICDVKGGTNLLDC